MPFYRLLQQAVSTDPHPLADLIGGVDAPLHGIEPLNEELQESFPSNAFGDF